MDKKLTVFTTLSPSYRTAFEFVLCLEMFKKALPEDYVLFDTEETNASALSDLLKKNLSSIGQYVLIVREPSVLIKRGTIELMYLVMENNPHISCVLPSDVRGFRPGKTADYHTLRSFEKFILSLYDPDNPVLPYDGRDPWMFLIKGEVLSRIELPEDTLNIPKVLHPNNTCIALNAYIHPFYDYYEEARADVLPFVPVNIKSLLDIGCARGNFGAAVKAKIGCRVTGVELNAYEAQKARAKLDAVIEGDILTSDIDEKFDCITCLDVIEHVVDPVLFLQRVRMLLNENGFLLLSIPNVGHWSIVEDLIAGSWDYIPAGILCVSHLRFFTRKTILGLLEDTGFRIESIEEQVSPLPEKFTGGFKMLQETGIEVDGKNLACLGYYILSKKTG